MPLARDKWGVLGGDCEPPIVLRDLALRHPGDEFVLVGINSGDDPASAGLPANVTNPWTQLRSEVRDFKRTRQFKSPLPMSEKLALVGWYDEHVLPYFAELDGLIVWAGQHGTTNSPLPQIGSGWDNTTNPQDAFVIYGSYLLRGINMFRARDPLTYEEVWLDVDARNYLHARDLKWPLRHPVLSQYKATRSSKFERYTDTRTPAECGFDATVDETGHVWAAKSNYIYSRLEMCSVYADCSYEWVGRQHFGLFINQARGYVRLNRKDAVRDWVLPLQPAFIHGVWPEDVQQELGLAIQPAPAELYYPTLQTVRSTFTTPSNGSGYATTKPWEAFAAGTVCFFHPAYDSQDNILRDLPAEASAWLRCREPADLWARVKQLDEDKDTWLYLVTEQRKLFEAARTENRHLRLIEERLCLT